MEREKLIDYAKRLKDYLKNATPTQIRKYMDVVKDSENFEEYRIYLEYQFARNRKYVSDPKRVIEMIKEIHKHSKERKEDWRENIAYTFGILWRLKKIEDNRRSD